MSGFSHGLPWLLTGFGVWLIAAVLALEWGLSVVQFLVLVGLCVLYQELNNVGRARWARRRAVLRGGRPQ